MQSAQAPVSVGEHVPADVARARLRAASGAEVAVGTFWETSPCLLVLMRHFGCVGCAEQVRDLAPRLFDLARAGVRTVLVGSGSGPQRDGFVERNALEGAPVEVVTDPSLGLYRALGLERSVWATLGPRALLDTARAMARGYPHLSVQGDATQQGGVLLVDHGGVVRFLYRSRSIADRPPASDLVEAALRLSLDERGPVATV